MRDSLLAYNAIPVPPTHSPQTIYHNPKDTHVAICTVGGICPGLNDVVRSLVHKASRRPARPWLHRTTHARHLTAA